jgi:hypothetical protein
MYEITRTVDVDASPETVWGVLTDFDSYDEWNPFMRVVGRANEGAHLVVELRPPGGRTTTFRPELVHVERNRELRWLGHLFVTGLFDGEHRFRLEPREDGGTHLVHSETFRGVLAGLLLRFTREQVAAGFEQMNAALKERAESLAAAGEGDERPGDADGTHAGVDAPTTDGVESDPDPASTA